MATQGRFETHELLAVDQRGMVQLPRDMLIEAGIEDELTARLVEDGHPAGAIGRRRWRLSSRGVSKRYPNGAIGALDVDLRDSDPVSSWPYSAPPAPARPRCCR